MLDGTGRYRVVREIGRGGMGVVYLGHDIERDMAVALKVHSSRDGQDMLWLKREFRVVGSMRHPNLVEFFDLVAEQQQCFFSMEYVDGVSALTWVNPHGNDVIDFSRVERVMFDLAQALAYLHERGVIHRDVKPGNVLVNAQGVLKLLDFGVALGARAMKPTDRHLIGTVEGVGHLTGTVPYLAPEYIARLSLGSSIDLYGLGVLAFRMCTGRVPFEGSIGDVQRAQAFLGQAPRAKLLNPDVPAHLDALIADLLQFDDVARPTADEVVTRLGATCQRTPSSALRYVTPRFVGRATELRTIVSHLQGGTRSGPPRSASVRTCTMVLVVGAAGVGKATLVQQAVGECRASVMSWRGRCRENEHIPYRAFDAIMDDISCGIAEGGLPADYQWSSALHAVFPNLQPPTIPIANSEQLLDPRVAKNSAHHDFAVLLDVLLGDRRGSLVIEELQWADPESIELIRVILANPLRRLTLLTSVTARNGQAVPAHILELLQNVDGIMVELAPLNRGDQNALVADLMPFASASAKQRVIEMSSGSPLLTVLYADESMVQTDLPTNVMEQPLHLPGLTEVQLDIQDATMMRLDRLGDSARVVGTYLASAAIALPFGQLADLTELAPLDLHAALRGLIDARLLRTTTIDGQRGYEFVHPGVCESVYRSIREVRRHVVHTRIASWYIAQPRCADFAAMIATQLGATPATLAGVQWCLTAADQAFDQLAFDIALFWFEKGRQTLIGLNGQGEPFAELYIHATLGLARSSQLAGNLAVAATAFRELAQRQPALATTWQCRAAEADLKAGDVERGMAFAYQVLHRHGVVATGSSLKSVFAATMQALFAMTQPRSVARVDATESQTFRMVTNFLATTRPLEAFDYTMRMWRVALACGDTRNINLAHALSAAYIIAMTNGALGHRIATMAIAQARKDQDGYAEAVGMAALGIMHLCRGDWAQMRDAFAAGERLSESLGLGKSWETSFLRSYRGLGEMQAGENDMALSLLTRMEQNTDDFVARTSGRAFRGRALVAAGQLEQARKLAGEVPLDEPALGMAQVQCDMFRCELALKTEAWPAALKAADSFERHARAANVWNMPAMRSDCDLVRATAYTGLAASPGPMQASYARHAAVHAGLVLAFGPFTAYAPIALRLLGDTAHSLGWGKAMRWAYRIAQYSATRRGGTQEQQIVAERLRTRLA